MATVIRRIGGVKTPPKNETILPVLGRELAKEIRGYRAPKSSEIVKDLEALFKKGASAPKKVVAFC